MPSLRRSASSPSVRPSPYPTSLSLSLSSISAGASASSASSRTRTAAPQPRRASGSDTTERRVLADIAWWKVADGQCPLPCDTAPGHDDARPLSPPDAVLTLSDGPALEHPPSPLLSLYAFSVDESSLDEYPSLATTPDGTDRRSHGRVSSFSSVESTPEVATPPLHPFDLDLDPFVDESFLETSLGPCFKRYHYSPLLFGCPASSFGGVSSRDNCQTHFADIGGDSFFLDRNIFS